MEDSLSGFLLNSLIFCSDKGVSTFDKKKCRSECIKSNPFWNAASKYFAQKARGEVKIILNGTRLNGAVNNQSTFYKYELPEFSSLKIHRAKIIVLHNLGKPKYETCTDPRTIQIITRDLSRKNIVYECEDNPKKIIALFCFQDETSKECQSIKIQLNNGTRNGHNFFIYFILQTFIMNYFYNL